MYILLFICFAINLIVFGNIFDGLMSTLFFAFPLAVVVCIFAHFCNFFDFFCLLPFAFCLLPFAFLRFYLLLFFCVFLFNSYFSTFHLSTFYFFLFPLFLFFFLLLPVGAVACAGQCTMTSTSTTRSLWMVRIVRCVTAGTAMTLSMNCTREPRHA